MPAYSPAPSSPIMKLTAEFPMSQITHHPSRIRILMIKPNMLNNLNQALEREWLVKNGIGGYASSSLVGANTRSYHGLLVASLPPPWGRQALLAKLDEELEVEAQTYQLATNEYW